jgi:hypothetical protein
MELDDVDVSSLMRSSRLAQPAQRLGADSLARQRKNRSRSPKKR